MLGLMLGPSKRCAVSAPGPAQTPNIACRVPGPDFEENLTSLGGTFEIRIIHMLHMLPAFLHHNDTQGPKVCLSLRDVQKPPWLHPPVADDKTAA